MILEYRRNHDPGVQTIFLGDTEIGRIRGNGAKEHCEVIERCRYDRTAPAWDLGRHEFPTPKDAKVYIARNIRRCYPGLEEKLPT